MARTCQWEGEMEKEMVIKQKQRNHGNKSMSTADPRDFKGEPSCKCVFNTILQQRVSI